MSDKHEQTRSQPAERPTPTGLKDRTGVDIHDGDVVRVFSRRFGVIVSGRVVPAPGLEENLARRGFVPPSLEMLWIVQDTLTGELTPLPDEQMRFVVLGMGRPWEARA